MPHNINTQFCLEVLKRVHVDVRQHLWRLGEKHIRPDLMRANPWKAGWVHKSGLYQWEFHGPDRFYWYGRAGNAYDARAQGWTAWLKAQGAEGYVR